MRDLSQYGISAKDQHEWQDVKEGYGKILPYPEVLRDKTKPVYVLNFAEEYVMEHNKGILRTLVGKIDGVFAAGLYTDEDREQRRKFDDSFKEEAAFVGRSFVFDRTSVLHLPKDQYLLTVEPTELAWGRIKVQDTPPAEAVEMFGLERIEENAEILIIPPCQTNIEEYVQATESRYNKLPHVAFWTVTRFADNVNWAIAEYNPGMPNLMGMEGGAL